MDHEIEQMAEKLAKSSQPTEITFEMLKATVLELGAEGLKKALPNLTESQRALLGEVLEDVKNDKQELEKAQAMDSEAVSEEGDAKENERKKKQLKEDEDLAKLAESDVNHQGDHTPEGLDTPIVKSESEVREIAQEEAESAMDEHEEEMHFKKKKKMEKSQFKAVIERMLEKGMDRDQCCEKLAKAQDLDVEKIGQVWDALEKAGEGSKGGKIIGHTKSGKPIYAGHVDGSTKASVGHPMSILHNYASSWAGSASQAKNDEYHAKRQQELHEDMHKYAEEKGIHKDIVEQVKNVHRGMRKKSDKDYRDLKHEAKKEGMSPGDYARSKMKKSYDGLQDPGNPFANRKIGQNCHYDVDEYIEKSAQEQAERLAKSTFDEVEPEAELKKSEAEANGVNDLIEKGQDLNANAFQEAEANAKAQPSGGFMVKSFDDSDMEALFKNQDMWAEDETKTEEEITAEEKKSENE